MTREQAMSTVEMLALFKSQQRRVDLFAANDGTQSEYRALVEKFNEEWRLLEQRLWYRMLPPWRRTIVRFIRSSFRLPSLDEEWPVPADGAKQDAAPAPDSPLDESQTQGGGRGFSAAYCTSRTQAVRSKGG